MPRVVCIAGDFTKYDESGIKLINCNISLIRYKMFGKDLLMFEQLNESVVRAIEPEEPKDKKKLTDKSFEEQLAGADKNINVLYEDLRNYILSLGDDIYENKLKLYVAFKKIKNVACAIVIKSKILLDLRLDVNTVIFEDGFSRDVTNIGHWGTGNVEVEIKTKADFEKAKALIDRAYNEN